LSLIPGVLKHSAREGRMHCTATLVVLAQALEECNPAITTRAQAVSNWAIVPEALKSPVHRNFYQSDFNFYEL
jgi:hypothetical protein